MNKVILIGRLGKDPETKTTETGMVITTLQIATEERFKPKDGEATKRTEWHLCKLFGKLAELSTQYLLKGDSVCLEGKLQTSKWEEKGGTHKYVTEIIVSNMEFLGKGNKSQEKADKAQVIEDNKKKNDSIMRDVAAKIFDIPKDDFGMECPF